MLGEKKVKRITYYNRIMFLYRVKPWGKAFPKERD